MQSATPTFIWPWWVRVVHWTAAGVFAADYFLLEPGSTLHNTLGYTACALIIGRVALGLRHRGGYADFSTLTLRPAAFVEHARELRRRAVPAAAGHNPFGWIMVLVIWGLFAALGVTGFMAQEIRYFRGNQTLDSVHTLAADALLVAVCIHVVSVIAVGYWGRVRLIGPMLTGYRSRR